MKKRNGMCPFCYAKQLVLPPKKSKGNVPNLYNIKPYDNGLALTPPMGWSSWNTFAERIDEHMLLEMAQLMKEKGLVDAGYVYLNIDDCWEAKERTMQGELQTDFQTFPSGMPALVQKVNALGMKLGIYSSNGILTCQSFPATLGFEYTDAYTFAKWGVEYWKLDFCHHVDYTAYAPYLAGVSIAEIGATPTKIYTAEQAKLTGYAHRFKTQFWLKRGAYSNEKFTHHVSGLDGGMGAAEFTVEAPADGEYVLTIYTHERLRHEKLLAAQINGGELLLFKIPSNVNWNMYSTQKLVQLKKGANSIKCFNPINNPATSDMLQYQYVGQCIKAATAQYAKDTGKPERKIMFSLCEWGAGQPHLWAGSAGNLWRTTGDIEAKWSKIVKLYEHNVQLYDYAGPGGWNDPDMLEVGVGGLTKAENTAHFALWCMMASPLILGNDIRKMSDEVLELVTNKALIAVNQDALGKQAKRIVTGAVDVLVKPLTDGTAVCIFNKGDTAQAYGVSETLLAKEEYIAYNAQGRVINLITGAPISATEAFSGTIEGRSVAVFKVFSAE